MGLRSRLRYSLFADCITRNIIKNSEYPINPELNSLENILGTGTFTILSFFFNVICLWLVSVKLIFDIPTNCIENSTLKLYLPKDFIKRNDFWNFVSRQWIKSFLNTNFTNVLEVFRSWSPIINIEFSNKYPIWDKKLLFIVSFEMQFFGKLKNLPIYLDTTQNWILSNCTNNLTIFLNFPNSLTENVRIPPCLISGVLAPQIYGFSRRLNQLQNSTRSFRPYCCLYSGLSRTLSINNVYAKPTIPKDPLNAICSPPAKLATRLYCYQNLVCIFRIKEAGSGLLKS